MSDKNENFTTFRNFVNDDEVYTGNITLVPSGLGIPDNQVKNLIINNTFRVPTTEDGEKTPVSGLIPYMELKDQLDGKFVKIEINDNTTYVGGNELIRRDELEDIINTDKIVFSNVYIDAYNPGNSYINFLSNASNIDLPPEIGFRVSNGFIEYLHKGESWSRVGTSTETFPTEMYLVTPASSQKSLAVPLDCAGVRIKMVAGGGWGGNASASVFSQGGGGGAGGFVDFFLTEDDIINCSNIDIVFQSPISPYGSNVEVLMKRPTLPTPTFVSVANAIGGSPGTSVIAPLTYSIDGGIGGTGSYVKPNQGYVINGGTGETGFWSEYQNLRYYSGGVGADSQMGNGGSGASTNGPASTAKYGGGGGGGLFVPQGMFDPVSIIPASNISYAGGSGGDPAVLVEFWINQEPWNISGNGGGGGGTSAYFKTLLDVNVTNDPTKKYLKYVSQIAINDTLTIVDDLAPQLGGNLIVGTHNIKFSDTANGIIDASGNLAVAINSSNSSTSYLVLKSSRLQGGEEVGEITVDSRIGDPDVGLAINTKGSGDLSFSAGPTGTIELAGNQVSINNSSVVEITSGHMTLASTYIADADLSSNISNPAVLNAATTASFIVIETAVPDQRYYLELSNGSAGQILNVIYDSSVSNTEVRLGFRDTATGPYTSRQVGIGSGLVNGLRFGISGQSSQMAFIHMTNDSSRSRWQVLNSGAYIDP